MAEKSLESFQVARVGLQELHSEGSSKTVDVANDACPVCYSFDRFVHELGASVLTVRSSPVRYNVVLRISGEFSTLLSSSKNGLQVIRDRLPNDLPAFLSEPYCSVRHIHVLPSKSGGGTSTWTEVAENPDCQEFLPVLAGIKEALYILFPDGNYILCLRTWQPGSSDALHWISLDDFLFLEEFEEAIENANVKRHSGRASVYPTIEELPHIVWGQIAYRCPWELIHKCVESPGVLVSGSRTTPTPSQLSDIQVDSVSEVYLYTSFVYGKGGRHD